MKKKVLFMCTHNSCRSQMAEALANHLVSDKIIAYSAGTKKSRVDPYAIKVMKELGIDISKNSSKTLDELTEKQCNEEEKILEIYRKVRDDIKKYILQELI